jgi:hypothetical protein
MHGTTGNISSMAVKEDSSIQQALGAIPTTDRPGKYF